jgi:hypothetical protein
LVIVRCEFKLHLDRHPREGGDPVFQSVGVSTTDAAEYWMPACAGMTPAFLV